MSSFSTTQLEKKIKTLTMSQQSIQTLSLWAMHHRKHAKTVVEAWFENLQKVKPKKKLALMYLANDILQNSRRKGPEYMKEFQTVLPQAFMHCCQEQDKKTLEQLKRILTIWLERGVYNNKIVTRLMSCCDQSGFGVGEIESHTPEGDPPDSDPEDGTAADDLVRT